MDHCRNIAPFRDRDGLAAFVDRFEGRLALDKRDRLESRLPGNLDADVERRSVAESRVAL